MLESERIKMLIDKFKVIADGNEGALDIVDIRYACEYLEQFSKTRGELKMCVETLKIVRKGVVGILSDRVNDALSQPISKAISQE